MSLEAIVMTHVSEAVGVIQKDLVHEAEFIGLPVLCTRQCAAWTWPVMVPGGGAAATTRYLLQSTSSVT